MTTIDDLMANPGGSSSSRLSWHVLIRARLGAAARLGLVFVRGPRRAGLRSAFLGIGALACYVAAGLTVSLTVGLVIAGVGLTVLDWRTAPTGVPDGTGSGNVDDVSKGG